MELNMLDLESLSLGAQPILSLFIDRLKLATFLDQALGPDDPRLMLPSVPTLLALLRNVASSRQPLYAVPTWLRRFVPQSLGIDPHFLALLNDDRIARCLDRLQRSDLQALQTRLIVHAVQAFGIKLAELHNDSTTITFSGAYEPRQEKTATPSPLITHGHNKDHRPDLKQLVFSLSITADGNIPIHYLLLDGNTPDDKTHIQTWDILKALHGSSEFIYVADCKLCNRESVGHIDAHGGIFVTVLPHSRSEDSWFKDHIQTHDVSFSEILSRPDPRDLDGEPEVFEAAVPVFHTSEGYRLHWFRSSKKRDADKRNRQSCLERAVKKLDLLAESPSLRRFKSREEVLEAANALVLEARAQRWIVPLVEEVVETNFKQQTHGRPGPKTRYQRVDKPVFKLSWAFIPEQLRYDDRTDGLFPLVVNKDHLTPLAVLEVYKRQAPLEKRHEQLKQVLEIMPVNLKSPSRIEAFVFVHFLAMLIHGLLERELRQAMKARGIQSLPIYPEARECQRPTAEKVLEQFEGLRRHRLMLLTQPVRVFWDPLTDLQRQILELLKVSATNYGE